MCKRLSVLISFVLVLGFVGNAGAQPTGQILFEYWMDIGGVNTSDLTSNAAYPDSPDESEWRTAFDSRLDWADNTGTRVRGFLYPPEDGDYTFWVSGDDGCDLFLSTDDDPANAVRIALVPDAGWTSQYQWDKYPEQQSAPVTLVAGTKYYIEGIMKEAGGGDSLTAGWTGPGIGDTLTIIDGAFLSPVIRVDDPLPAIYSKARDPIPADGAIEVDDAALEWTAGITAVSHKVYLSANETIDDADLLGETDLTIQIAILDPGVTYYWRVDEVEADGNVIEGDVWSLSTLALEAHFPSPADGAGSQSLTSQLGWTAGKVVIMHDVYFGTDEAAIAARDMTTFKGKLMTESYDPGALEIETTYYWAVDQFTPTGTVAGPVWSFTTLGSIAITDPDLLLYYDFELGEASVALDQSGHSNHGHFKGDPLWVAGPFGGAVSIDIATLDYIETAAPLGITSNTVSVTGWVKHDELPAGWSGILTTRGSGNLGLQHDGTELRYMWGPDIYWDFSSGLALPVGEWYFAAVTISPDQGKLYLNGVEQTATNVAPHDPVNFDSLIRVGRDHNDGRIMTSLIDEVRFYNKTLTDADIQGMLLSDVTAPGDVVKGVPDEPRDGSIAGWPDGEYPGLAVDDDVSTKFLHFKGNVQPTGFVVEPAIGPTIVTGLTLTTANDSPERDPASFELSGSNDSIDGPYTLIAAGDVADFAMADAWPRFTTNATAIAFDNAVGYKYYQVMFPTVRDAGSANSMQIAEVELLGVPAPVARWEFDGVFAATGGSGQTGIPVGAVAFEADPARGLVLSLPGGDDQFVDLGSVGISGNDPTTITCWAKADHTDIPNWTLIFGFTGQEDGSGGNGSHFNIGSLGGPGGVGAHVWGWEETIFSDDEALEWHHYAMTYDGTTIQYYGDGVPMDTDLGKSNVRDLSARADRVHAGSRITQASSFPGKVDDARIYSQALSALQIRDIASAAALSGPVAYWALDDGAGIVALDSSGNAIDGVVVGEPLWVGGMLDGALELDGVDDYVDCGNPAVLDFGTGDFTISAWIKLTATERATVFAKGGDNGGGIRYTLAMGESNDNQMTLTTDDDSTKAQTRGATVVNDGAWHHVVGMREGNTGFVYVDGVLDGTEELPEGYDLSGSSQANALIGAITDARDATGATLEKFFAGTIDDVRVYDRALSDSEVATLALKTGNIIWVNGFYDDNGDGAVDDLEWVDILEAEGYAVDNSESYVDLDDAKIAALNAADLIIVSRNSNSGDYDDGDEIAQWNAITTPIINSSTHIVRSSRWKFFDSTSLLNLAPATMVLADGTEVSGINEAVGPTSFIDAAPGNGTVLATGDGLPWIVEWEAGVEYYDGAGQIAGGTRVFFAAGTQESADPLVGRGEMNLTADGLVIFLNAVEMLVTQ